MSSLEYECDDKTKHMLMEVGLEGLDQARRLACRQHDLALSGMGYSEEQIE